MKKQTVKKQLKECRDIIKKFNPKQKELLKIMFKDYKESLK